MIRKLLALLFMTVSFLQVCSQEQDSIRGQDKFGEKKLSLLVGYNVWSNHYLEMGLAFSQLFKEDYNVVGRNIYIATEIRIAKNLIWGPKIGIWSATQIGGLGLSLINYMDGQNTTLRLRPELGIGLSRFKLTYGYNFALTNKDFKGINRSNICLNLLLGLKDLKKKKR